MPIHHEAPELQQPGASAQLASSSSHAPQVGKKTSRPTRAVRRPVRYTQFFDSHDEDGEDERGDYEAWQSTDSEAEEDARIERSMGVIRKNAASRGSEGGNKYHCDV
jgi:hypothetical protein